MGLATSTARKLGGKLNSQKDSIRPFKDGIPRKLCFSSFGSGRWRTVVVPGVYVPETLSH